MECLTSWLWDINEKGTLVESVAATNYAIEGITQPLSVVVLETLDHYCRQVGAVADARTSRWLEVHAEHDEEHLQQALATLEKYAVTPEARQAATRAARRSLELFLAVMNSDWSA
jgi:pyrroloquinoline quinone (PQQ) biosynthesis protein C